MSDAIQFYFTIPLLWGTIGGFMGGVFLCLQLRLWRGLPMQGPLTPVGLLFITSVASVILLAFHQLSHDSLVSVRKIQQLEQYYDSYD